jgi:hypothetical protein
MIQEAEVDHEICTHTFSHVPVDDAESEVVRCELQRAIDEDHEFELPKPQFFVPPRHQCPSYDVLTETPIKLIRRPFDDPNEPGGLRRYLSTVNRRHPVGNLLKQDGIVEIYTTAALSLTAPYLPNGQRSTRWTHSVLPLSIQQQKQSRYLLERLEKAIRQHSQAHYWTHLSSLSATEQQPPVETYFEELRGQEDDGDIMPIRMADCRNIANST